MRRPSESAIFIRRGDRYLVTRRSSDGRWNTIAGQVEPGETHAEAARRELAEEAGIDADVFDLAMARTYPVPDELRELYPPDVTEVRIESFGLDVAADWEPVLNDEHDDYRWCTVDEAIAILHWPEAREALRALARSPAQSPGT